MNIFQFLNITEDSQSNEQFHAYTIGFYVSIKIPLHDMLIVKITYRI